jgi:hypothetical protein
MAHEIGPGFPVPHLIAAGKWASLALRATSPASGRGDDHYSSDTSSSATMLMILISGLMAGSAASMYGSPTVSPVTAALCVSEPLPPGARMPDPSGRVLQPVPPSAY